MARKHPRCELRSYALSATCAVNAFPILYTFSKNFSREIQDILLICAGQNDGHAINHRWWSGLFGDASLAHPPPLAVRAREDDPSEYGAVDGVEGAKAVPLPPPRVFQQIFVVDFSYVFSRSVLYSSGKVFTFTFTTTIGREEK